MQGEGCFNARLTLSIAYVEQLHRALSRLAGHKNSRQQWWT